MRRGSIHEEGSDRVVRIMRGARRAVVDPACLYIETIAGRRVVALTDLWVASQLPGDLVDLSFHFIGEGDRFTSICVQRLGIELVMHVHLDLETHDLVWEEGIDVPWYHRVKRVQTIITDDSSDRIALGYMREEASRSAFLGRAPDLSSVVRTIHDDAPSRRSRAA
jgi:hypothetical protein